MLFYVFHPETVWFRCANRTFYGRKLYVSRKGNVKNALKKKRWLQSIPLFSEVEERYSLIKGMKKGTPLRYPF